MNILQKIENKNCMNCMGRDILNVLSYSIITLLCYINICTNQLTRTRSYKYKIQKAFSLINK
jgi:hypothetical protein